MRKCSKLVDKGSKSQSGPVTVTKVSPWNPTPRRVAGFDRFGNPVFEAVA